MAKHNIWISVSDLMTGLMILFMFIAIAYIRKVQKSTSVLSDYVETKDRLHEKLVKEFEGDTVRWDMSIGKDLSMKFKNPSTLFESGSAELTPTFKEILNEFIPRYFNILINDELKDDIMEIRIEGHTDDVPYPQLDKDPYIANVILSQKRALSVLVYIRNLTSFSEYSQEEKETLEYWITANGLSYGKSLNNQGQYTYKKKESIEKAK